MTFAPSQRALRLRQALTAAALNLALPAWAGPRVTIETRDHQLIQGELADESARGYLVSTPTETRLVDYGNVVRIAREGQSPAPTPQSGENSARTLGLGLAALGGPAFGSGFGTGLSLRVPLDFGSPGSRLGFRLTPALSVPFAHDQHDVWRRGVELTAEAELRLHFSSAFSSGVGVYAGPGLAIGVASQQTGIYFGFGPQVTLASIRWGSERDHELQLDVAVALAKGSGDAASLDTVRGAIAYSHFF